MKAYLITTINEIRFTDGEFETSNGEAQLIEERNFTPEEIQFPKIISGKIQVDTSALNLSLKSILDKKAKEAIAKINSKTKALINESGYQFKNNTMSSSESHRTKIDKIFAQRANPPTWFSWGFQLANKDDSGFVTVDSVAEIEAMKDELNQLEFSTGLSGNVEKKKILDIVAETITKPPTKTLSEAITAIENYIDSR